MFSGNSFWVYSLALLSWCAPVVLAAEPGRPSILTRIVWQDDDARTLRSADLLEGDQLQLGSVVTVTGFPQLDTKRQTLVQMEATRGMILVGVRDDDGGKFQSGWVLVDAGVEEDEHGDHSHWYYTGVPRVRASTLDVNQGNPAHLYCYDESFFVANDKLNGFTWLNPRLVTAADQGESICRKAAFHPGGGGHITLAVVNRRLAFSSWIDRERPNKGRVDLTVLSPNGAKEVGQTFHLPYGGIHGATANAGRVFFAPSEGICWLEGRETTEVPAIHHIPLGSDEDRPRRTGAFTTFEKYVTFVTGSGAAAAFCFLDATQANPEVTRLPLKFTSASRPTGLEIIKPRHGSPLGFLFQDHSADREAPYRLTILELDPNGDQNWQDAKVSQELIVGSAKVEGHGGHHCITFDADRRRAIFANPGDGTIAVISLDDRKQIAQFKVGGVPSKIIAIGGISSAD